MLLKSVDDKDAKIEELEKLLASEPGDRRARIEQELRITRAGLKGERDAAYHINFDYKDNANYVVIHDLRIEIGDRVAQIDHLLINRMLDCFVLESKHFNSGIKITEEGEFLRWNPHGKTYEGMAFPIAQNTRHIHVLKDAFATIEMPTRLGLRLSPAFHSYILVSANARVDRPKHFDTSRVIKSDGLRQAIGTQIDKMGILESVGGMARMISTETLESIGRKVLALHKPARNNVSARFGGSGRLPAPPNVATTPAARQSVQAPASGARNTAPKAKCRACGTENVSIQYGKYGYYFKCGACEGNTPIKLDCGRPGHKERIRKDGHNFFRECADCDTSSIYFLNPV